MSEQIKATFTSDDLDRIFDDDGHYGAPIDWSGLSESSGRVLAASRAVLDQRGSNEDAAFAIPVYASDFATTNALVSEANLETSESLPDLRHLVFLRVGETARAEKIEDLLANCPNLDSLDLQWRIWPTDNLNLECIRNPALLKNLRIGAQHLSSLSELTKFESLQRLSLGWTTFDKLSALAGMEDLRILSLKGGSALSGLRSMQNLESFEIEDPASFAGFRNFDWPSIRKIGLCGSTVKSVNEIGLVESLEQLSLVVTSIRDLSPIADLKSLRNLRIDDSTGSLDLRHVAELSGLRTLSLAGRGRQAWPTDFRFAEGLKNIEALSISTSAPDLDLSPLVGLEALRRLRINAPSGAWQERLSDFGPAVKLR